jgi:hypothetical protein
VNSGLSNRHVWNVQFASANLESAKCAKEPEMEMEDSRFTRHRRATGALQARDKQATRKRRLKQNQKATGGGGNSGLISHIRYLYDRPGAKSKKGRGGATRCSSRGVGASASAIQWGRPWCSYRIPFGYGVREAGSGTADEVARGTWHVVRVVNSA